ncbi:ABC transporter permease [Rhodobacter sp. Har01]|uniref:ABC transporter permease n=1 Tax=Rhodobacter sp. Har01 TaxID=2883999 RepID=UPI001D07CCFA|nr:ABC transporter permease [Rhodobacter sp. Har01]MCB6177069.1 ABC transporter permease [Rhodobacter sp. Har01]
MAKSNSAEARAGWLLAAPPAVYAALLLAAPLATVLLYSVLTGEKGAVSTPFTLSNYAEILSKPVYKAVMWRSLYVSMLVTLTTVLLAYPIAYFVSFHVSPSKKSLWLFLITIPFWTSYIIRVSLWRTILGYDGIIDSTLISTGLMDSQLNILSNGVISIIITLSHAYAPFAVLPIFVSLEKVERPLLEAGQDLGESKLMTFLRVTLPLSMPGVIAAVLIVFIPTVGDYVTPELIGGGKTPMVANLIESQMLKQRDQAMGSALAVTAMLIVGIVSVVFVLMNRRFIGGQK